MYNWSPWVWGVMEVAEKNEKIMAIIFFLFDENCKPLEIKRLKKSQAQACLAGSVGRVPDSS